ncbi:uncharacterized protein LOC125675077 [Ostrea edulis]|uniref:uncharacterized protein LOC125675077 n=1 Tax=Ostrea edulis TaxID=37623 RepID=UPI0024AEB490|nr:uncharacterized protein LOC125675077 [Ostrea edulis]XP_048768535.2 uncharacterized protein LOC125675077 [Ostrea edulis]XP_048768536.2 uncharacterized protein LOC125675077 [Ostrea edulis]XP_056015943.1 uncharacterized protein LOC125675077 [Ostrea edulis]
MKHPRKLKMLFQLLLSICLFKEGHTNCSSTNVSYVESCPQSKDAMEIATAKFKCDSECHSLKYHCLPDTQMERYIEVCAEEGVIIGQVCPEYNTLGRRVQANRHNIQANCAINEIPCPHAYLSTEFQKYQSCFPVLRMTSTGIYTRDHENDSDDELHVPLPIIVAVPFIIGILCISPIALRLVKKYKNHSWSKEVCTSNHEDTKEEENLTDNTIV